MNQGKLEAIWIKRKHHGPMEGVEAATLVAGRGIAGSANQGGRRQVTVIEQEIWTRLMNELNAALPPATRRANLMVSRMPLANSRGKILVLGNCRIRILGETEPCGRMEEALPGLRDAMVPGWHGGAFGEVLDGGVITVGEEAHWESLHAT